MKQDNNFTEGPIAFPLIKFVLPVLMALFLQSLYGAVDLLIVGQFAEAADVSAVSTGSMIMHTLTGLISSLAMGTTVMIGRMIGERNKERAGDVMGASIVLFFLIGAVLTVLIPALGTTLASVMNAPAEAFAKTTAYIRICGGGIIVIIAYNLIGSIFRGIGDSTTPLITVAIACAFNIVGDLLLVAVFHMGTSGAAIATVAAQMISVLLSLILIRRKELPFAFSRSKIRPHGDIIRRVLRLGVPIALQDLLVGISFLVILAIVNSISLMASAGVGVAERVCGFIMLVPSAFSQAMAAFTAQNMGAGKYTRARRALFIAIAISTCAGVCMFVMNFWYGHLLARIFTADGSVILAAADYLKAYAIDCMLTCFLFCFMGYFNGLGMSTFVMAQGIIGAFCVRVPVSFLMSKWEPVSLFHIGLATPMSTVLQCIMCVCALIYANRRFRNFS